MTAFTESTVEEAALAWLESLGWSVAHGPDIAPDTPGAERSDYGAVVLEPRLRDALVRLNPSLPTEALDDAFRKLTHLEGPTLEARNRAFHRLLVDGVTVEYRTDEGALRGAQPRVIDFDTPANNDWLAVNQFTVVENKHERRPDIVLFVNGLPLGVIELKNSADEDATPHPGPLRLGSGQALPAGEGVMRRATGIHYCRSGATSWSLPTRPTAASTILLTAIRGICGTPCPMPRLSALPARRLSCRTPTPEPCLVTTSASMTFSARLRIRPRCRSITRAGWPNWPWTRANGRRSTPILRTQPRARRSGARKSSRPNGRNSKRLSARKSV